MAEKKKSSKSSISEMIEELIGAKIDSLLVDAEKFDEGNNSAGTRVRKELQGIKVAIKEIRDAVTAVREDRK